MDNKENKYKNKTVIGVDETGVGDYFTPLVGASVYLTPEQTQELKELGVKDSKQLSEKQITFFANKIRAYKQHEIHHLTQRGYNSLTRYLNAHELKTLIHLTTINKLLNKFKPDFIILDQFVNEKKWHEYEEKLNKSVMKIKKVNFPITFVTNGEQEHIAVAAASIMARDFMVKMVAVQNNQWEITFPLGSSNPKIIEVGKEFVAKYGKSKLYQVAKISFKTTEKILG